MSLITPRLAARHRPHQVVGDRRGSACRRLAAAELGVEDAGLGAEPLGALDLAGSFVGVRGSLAVVHLGPDDLLDLRGGERAPLRLGGADAEDRSRERRGARSRLRLRRLLVRRWPDIESVTGVEAPPYM